MRPSLAMLIGCLAGPALGAGADDWSRVLDGYDLRVYADTVRTTKEAGGATVVEFLATWDTPRPIPNPDGGTVKSIKAQATIFCNRRTYGSFALRGTGYSEAGMQGATLFSDKDLGYQSIEPGTLWYELHTKYCRPWWKKVVPNKLLQLLN